MKQFNHQRNNEIMQSLQERIAKLEKENQDLKNYIGIGKKVLIERIAELEHYKSYYQDFIKNSTDCDSINKLVSKYKKQQKRIAEFELWIECAIKPELQIPEWIRVSASSLLKRGMI